MLEEYHASRMRKIVDEKRKEKVRMPMLMGMLEAIHTFSRNGESTFDASGYGLNEVEIDTLRGLGYVVKTSTHTQEGIVVSHEVIIKW